MICPFPPPPLQKNVAAILDFGELVDGFPPKSGQIGQIFSMTSWETKTTKNVLKVI